MNTPLRKGFTTGTCAAAAAGAAAEMLLTGRAVTETAVRLPGGQVLHLPVISVQIGAGAVSCAVVKDSGDDPDITNGIAIFAQVSCIPSETEITGGEGIGIVTKPGLDQPVGAYAINSTPRHMIAQALQSAAERHDYSGGFRAVISIPGGEALAQKTYNPHMGIAGGLSVIGTTGIVEPMSTAALLDTIRLEMNMRKAAGERILLLTLGNYGEQFLEQNLTALVGRDVKCSNFIGDAITMGLSMEFEGILIIGHIGKLVKLGSGIFQTHSSFADGRMETLIACGVLAGADPDVLRKLTDCATVDAALSILQENDCMNAVLNTLTARIGHYLRVRVRDALPIGAAIFSYQHDIWLQTEQVPFLIQQLTED